MRTHRGALEHDRAGCIKGELLLLEGAPGASAAAENLYRQGLDWARRQAALSSELRCAISLARLWHDQARSEEARQLLAAIYHRFTEGFATARPESGKIADRTDGVVRAIVPEGGCCASRSQWQNRLRIDPAEVGRWVGQVSGVAWMVLDCRMMRPWRSTNPTWSGQTAQLIRRGNR